MMHLVSNSGILGDDRLDKLRGNAICAHHETPLPDAIVRYIRALEAEYADQKHEQRKKNMREIGWKLASPSPDATSGEG